MTTERFDETHMAAAIELAWGGLGRVEPNPMVGCLLVRDGRVIGRGYHEVYGQGHAEVNALADCAEAGQDPRGATAYVTLEPCCHQGKTPPCADALIAAGITRVVVAVVDPFEQVAGGGIERLRSAGIEVVTGVAVDAATEQLAAYLKRVRTGRPWVIAKWAMSIDGRIATASGQSQWITGASARREVHALRGRVDAIAVGMGTVVADDPLLTARPSGPRTLHRIIFAQTRVPALDRQLIQTATESPVWLIAGPQLSEADLRPLIDQGVDIVRCESVDPAAMIDEGLQRLGSKENPAGQPLTNLMIEGGGKLLGSFAAAGQIDECHVYIGGKLIGGQSAPGPVGDPGFAELTQSPSFQINQIDSFDNDVRIVYRRQN
ncbi:bifunctional diaminohydroxyphosphoribosylaminopyrimidine deaminase/5-amino-6-(5-phosphoribosylamino)uracil reductase RibD [Allorhodopirellula solitaria]|uniref:Riboflavin biosynthesis protein RibD n=1 Tax=Allorhodopirellula solitaria TaxID=2527987 RepID=A0A5C5WZD1_9BACT|nr:bifunctional diaminohydroxyphosphoribosylaminopyrimidine deaminase/5-amino-6-(5-phosphoribosylamino)uracil reductase RibD [Allorhodopirellula solitaria]TWT55649.1 Riboflavin biosynthesis protein RibD [Allorhodopirellula solitaria]